MLLHQKCKLQQVNKTEQEPPEENICTTGCSIKIQKSPWKQRIGSSVAKVWNQSPQNRFLILSVAESSRLSYHSQTSHFLILYSRDVFQLLWRIIINDRKRKQIKSLWCNNRPVWKLDNSPKAPNADQLSLNIKRKWPKLLHFLVNMQYSCNNGWRKWQNCGSSYLFSVKQKCKCWSFPQFSSILDSFIVAITSFLDLLSLIWSFSLTAQAWSFSSETLGFSPKTRQSIPLGAGKSGKLLRSTAVSCRNFTWCGIKASQPFFFLNIF